MSHPNVDLASDLQKCVDATDSDSVELAAVAGKRKGYLLLDLSTKRYVLTAKGKEFVSKWQKNPVAKTTTEQVTLKNTAVLMQQRSATSRSGNVGSVHGARGHVVSSTTAK